MSIQVKKKKLSVQDYHKMAEVGILAPDDCVELINGEIYQMSPIKSLHASHVNRIALLLARLIEDDYHLITQNPIQLDSYSEPEPDLALVKKDEQFYLKQHPKAADTLWVIEVADSSLEYDRTIKGELYAQADIPFYWIINLQDYQIEAYAKPEHGQYTEHTFHKLENEFSLPFLSVTRKGTDFLIQSS